MVFSLFATLLSNLHLCHTSEIKAKSDFTPVPSAGATGQAHDFLFQPIISSISQSNSTCNFFSILCIFYWRRRFLSDIQWECCPSPSEKGPSPTPILFLFKILLIRIGIRDVSISPKSYVKNGLRLIESLRLGENWRQPNGHLKDMACRERRWTPKVGQPDGCCKLKARR